MANKTYDLNTTGSGSGGDATAANQAAQIALETALNALVATAPNQATIITQLTTIQAEISNLYNQVAFNIVGVQATAANQATEIASLSDIDGNTNGTLVNTNNISSNTLALVNRPKHGNVFTGAFANASANGLAVDIDTFVTTNNLSLLGVSLVYTGVPGTPYEAIAIFSSI
jgi:hypothetical protein